MQNQEKNNQKTVNVDVKSVTSSVLNIIIILILVVILFNLNVNNTQQLELCEETIQKEIYDSNVCIIN